MVHALYILFLSHNFIWWQLHITIELLKILIYFISLELKTTFLNCGMNEVK